VPSPEQPLSSVRPFHRHTKAARELSRAACAMNCRDCGGVSGSVRRLCRITRLSDLFDSCFLNSGLHFLDSHLSITSTSTANLRARPRRRTLCGLREMFRRSSAAVATSRGDRRPACQDLALSLSAKRRLCNTVGGRGIEGSTRSCAISIARSRAAATTNLARPNQSWVLRVLFARVKGCALIKVFMICPPWRLKPTTTKFCAWITAVSWLKDRSHDVQKMMG
jgi:hypothetical protein